MDTKPFDLTGKTAVVTGASRGIGEAVARLLADWGAHVIVSSRRAEACEEVVAAIRDAGGVATALPAHIGDTAAIDALFQKIADKGFGADERKYWETDAVWQGFRELMEKTLTVWDWGEAIVVLNLIAKPAIEESVLRKLGESARHNGDMLLGLITDAQLIDAARHRRWLTALVKMAQETPGNLELIQGWIAKWEPLADKAIDAYCSALPDVADAAAVAKAATREFRRNLGL